MTRFSRVLLLLPGLLLVVSAPAAAQGPVTISTAGGEITVLADRIEHTGADNLFIATGNVEVIRGTGRLLADRVEINRDTGEAIAQGRVIFYDGDNRLTGQRIEYNFKSGTGVVYQAEARTAPHYRIAGEQMERLSESVYRVRRGVFTTCEDDSPPWSFRFGSATADLDNYVYGTNASFWVKNVPLIPWFPFFAAAIRRERQSGFLFPRLGNSSRKGVFTEIPFYWAISDSQDATLALDYYSKRGVGGTAEYRYILSERHRGSLDGFFLNQTEGGEETNDNDPRWVGGWRHDWAISPVLTVRADVNRVSDDRVLRDYGDRLHQRSAQRVESNIFLTRTWANWNLVGNLFWYQDLTTGQPVELQRLPEIRLEGLRQPLPGLPGFLYETEASYVKFVRDAGSDGMRFDVHPRVSRPISAAGYFTVTPFLGGRLTAYEKTLAGTQILRDEVTVVDLTIDEPRVRRFLEIGSDIETRAARVYRVGGWAGLDTLLHTVEPRARYIWLTGDNFGRVPIWTEEVDHISEGSRIEYSVVNRVQARTVARSGLEEPVRWEIARLTLSNIYDLKNGQFGLIAGDVLFQPSDVLRVRADAAYSTRRDEPRNIREGFQTAHTDVAVTLPYVTAAVGTRFSDPDRVNFLQGSLAAELSRYLVARLQTNWDMREQRFVENRIAADLRYQCWALTVEYVDRGREPGRRQGDDEFRFAVNLLGLGEAIKTSVGVGGR
jgi:LPS-assembly protein